MVYFSNNVAINILIEIMTRIFISFIIIYKILAIKTRLMAFFNGLIKEIDRFLPNFLH